MLNKFLALHRDLGKEYFSGLTVYSMFSGARGNETNEVLNERKKETTESLRIGGIINHRLWQPDLSWSDSHRATYTYYVQEYSSIRVRCSVYVCYIAVSKFLWITCSIII